jgi:hypothetical protein
MRELRVAAALFAVAVIFMTFLAFEGGIIVAAVCVATGMAMRHHPLIAAALLLGVYSIGGTGAEVLLILSGLTLGASMD